MELVLRGEAASKQLSSAPLMAEARQLFERVLKLQPDNVDARAGVAATDIFEVVNGYYRSGNEQRRERAEPRPSRALAIDDRDVAALKVTRRATRCARQIC
jgi:hypothetical protein